MQRVSFSRAHLALPLTECDCFAKCRRRVPAEHKLSELKEHRTRERRELFSCGFHGITKSSAVCDTVVVPMDDDGRCAISMFLAVGGDLTWRVLRFLTPHPVVGSEALVGSPHTGVAHALERAQFVIMV